MIIMLRPNYPCALLSEIWSVNLERDKIGDIILQHVAEFVSQWGVLIIGIEIKDVIVSKELEDAISREAAAEREKRARLKLAEAEELSVDFIINAADKFGRFYY